MQHFVYYLCVIFVWMENEILHFVENIRAPSDGSLGKLIKLRIQGLVDIKLRIKRT